MKRLLLLPALLGLAACHYLEVKQTVVTPAPAAAAPAGPVSLHLATFRQPIDKDESWARLTRDYPEVGQYPPRIAIVPDVAYTRLYELFIDGVPGEVAAGLCADMMAHDQYCAIQMAAVPPASVTSETTISTSVSPALPPPPPVEIAPAPPPAR